MPNLFFFYAAGEIQAGVIAIGIALVPILTLVGATLLRQEMLTLGRAIGILLGASGVMMVLLPETSLPESDDVFFVLIAFAGAVCYAAEHLYIDARLPEHVGLDTLLFIMFAAASALLTPVVLLTNTFIVPSFPFGVLEIAIISIVGITLLDYVLITHLIVWAGPVFTSQAAYIVTVAGVLWGIVIFGDSHSLWVWGAIGLLLLGLAFVHPRAAG